MPPGLNLNEGAPPRRILRNQIVNAKPRDLSLRKTELLKLIRICNLNRNQAPIRELQHRALPIAVMRKIRAHHKPHLVQIDGPAKFQLPPQVQAQPRSPRLVGPYAMTPVLRYAIDRIPRRKVIQISRIAIGTAVRISLPRTLLRLQYIAWIHCKISIAHLLLLLQWAHSYHVRTSSKALRRVSAPRLLFGAPIWYLVAELPLRRIRMIEQALRHLLVQAHSHPLRTCHFNAIPRFVLPVDRMRTRCVSTVSHDRRSIRLQHSHLERGSATVRFAGQSSRSRRFAKTDSQQREQSHGCRRL